MAVKGKFGGDADAGMNGEHSSMTGLLMEPVVRIVITRKCCRVSTIWHPELADEWHKTRNGSKKPSDYVYGSHKYAWWTCPLGHDYQRTIADRHDGYGCPYCSNVKVLAGFNDLATKTPWLAKEWDPERNRRRTPQEVFPSSNLKVWWRCEGGHHWRASISGRQSGSRCPYCYGLVPRKAHYIT